MIDDVAVGTDRDPGPQPHHAAGCLPSSDGDTGGYVIELHVPTSQGIRPAATTIRNDLQALYPGADVTVHPTSDQPSV